MSTGIVPLGSRTPGFDTVVLAIGRNVGNLPMSRERWRRFRDALRQSASAAGGEFAFEGVGTGRYEGRGEDSYSAIVQVTPRFNYRVLESALLGLLDPYEQQAIALIPGVARFLTRGTTGLSIPAHADVAAKRLRLEPIG